ADRAHVADGGLRVDVDLDASRLEALGPQVARQVELVVAGAQRDHLALELGEDLVLVVAHRGGRRQGEHGAAAAPERGAWRGPPGARSSRRGRRAWSWGGDQRLGGWEVGRLGGFGIRSGPRATSGSGL